MERKLTAVYDYKAKLFIAPQFVRNDAEATRAFAETVNNPETYFHKYPKDYALMALAVWDDESGKITPLEIPEKIVDAFAILDVESRIDHANNPPPKALRSNRK